MKRIIYLTSLLFAMLFMVGCTHNNGDIGPWWGQWKVERIELNGEPEANYKGDFFFRWQSSVICVVRSYPNSHSSGISYGNWSEHDGVMDVEFKEGGLEYEQLGLDKVCRLDIIKRDGREKILEYKKDDKTVYTYYLKTW